MMEENLLQEAVRLIRSGQKEKARSLLLQLLRQNPRQEKAWLWLVECLPDVDQRIIALERCLQHNPQSQVAQQALSALRSRKAAATTQDNTAVSGTTPATPPTPVLRIPEILPQAGVPIRPAQVGPAQKEGKALEKAAPGSESADLFRPALREQSHGQTSEAHVPGKRRVQKGNQAAWQPADPPPTPLSTLISPPPDEIAALREESLKTKGKRRTHRPLRKKSNVGRIFLLIFGIILLALALIAGYTYLLPLAVAQLAQPTLTETVYLSETPTSTPTLTRTATATLPSATPTLTITPSPTGIPSWLNGRWRAVKSLPQSRAGHASVLLQDGRILIAGGYTVGSGDLPYTTLDSVLIYDKGENKYSPASPMAGSRANSSALLLLDGRVLVVGGEVFDKGEWRSVDTAELYDVVKDAWIPVPPIGQHGQQHTLTLLKDGRVLLTGGCSAQKGMCTGNTEIFDPKSNQWRLAASLSTAVSSHSATLLDNGQVLVAGGMDDYGLPLQESWLYDPVKDQWNAAGSLARARFSPQALLLNDGRVLVVGGMDADQNILSEVELFDPAVGTWQRGADLPVTGMGFELLLLSDGDVFALGKPLSEVESARSLIYRPVQNAWIAAPDMQTGRSAFSKVLLTDGSVIIFGGLDVKGKLSTSVELYQPGLAVRVGTVTFVPTLTTTPTLAFTPTPLPTLPPVSLPAPLYFLSSGAADAGQSIKQQVWRLEKDGTTLRRITNLAASVDWLDVSPVDGSLAYVSNNKLYVADALGKKPRLLVDGGSYDKEKLLEKWQKQLTDPVWSRDGTSLAYGLNGVNIYWLSGGQNTLLLQNTIPAQGQAGNERIYTPSVWAPDGLNIITRVGLHEGVSLVIVSAAGGNVIQPEDITTCCEVTFSADGKKLILGSSTILHGDPGLWEIDLTTGVVRVLINWQEHNWLTAFPKLGADGILHFLLSKAPAAPVVSYALASAAIDTPNQVVILDKRTLLGVLEVLWVPQCCSDTANFAIISVGDKMVIYTSVDGKIRRNLPAIGRNLRWGIN